MAWFAAVMIGFEVIARPGVVAGADAGPVPTALVAVTVQVDPAPGVSPLTTIGEVAPLALCVPHRAV